MRRCSLVAALAASFCGMGWLALAYESSLAAGARERCDLFRASVRTLRILGVVALITSMVLCTRANHPSIAVLVWVMSLAAAALLVALRT